MWQATCASLTLLFFTSFCLSVRSSRVVLDANNSTESQLASTLRALSSTLLFFNEEYKNVNLDAVIGTRAVEGSLTVLLNRLDASGQGQRIPEKYIRSIRAVRDLAGRVSVLATPYVALKDPDYYKRIGAILRKGFWELDYNSRSLSKSIAIWPRTKHENTEEDFSDHCLAEFFGTGGKTTEKCHITDMCWTAMTTLGYSGYSLSHQIFYLEIGERFGCLPEILEKVVKNRQPSLSSLRETYCANMLDEVKLIAGSGFQVHRKDLFMEDAALCGMLGYRDFFNSEWLEHILSWQKPGKGCYLASPREIFPNVKTGKQRTQLRELEGITATTLKKRDLFAKSRVKREEKKLPDGCLCHRTTVAAGALAQYVRYITEVWLMEK